MTPRGRGDVLALVRGTWAPTVILAAAILCAGLSLGVINLEQLWVLVLALLVVTPTVWWWLVLRTKANGIGRGAAAGALSAAVVFMMPIIWMIGRTASQGTGGEAGLTTMFFVLVIGGIAAVAVLIGALSGLLAAVLNRWWTRRNGASAKTAAE